MIRVHEKNTLIAYQVKKSVPKSSDVPSLRAILDTPMKAT